MAQWTSLNQNNIFINPTLLPLLCEKSGVIHLAELGLTAGWLAGRRNTGKFEIFKIRCELKYYTFCCV